MFEPQFQGGSRHRLIEHTGEVELEVKGRDLAEVFEEAGRALSELMLEEAGERLEEAVVLRVEARDVAGLMFEWLNELIFRSEVDGVVFTDFKIEDVTERALVARVRAVVPRALRTAVKAATFHRLAVEERDHEVVATVVLDV